MLQYLRTERIIPPYQTRGYKLVELVRIYEVGHAAAFLMAGGVPADTDAVCDCSSGVRTCASA